MRYRPYRLGEMYMHVHQLRYPSLYLSPGGCLRRRMFFAHAFIYTRLRISMYIYIYMSNDVWIGHRCGSISLSLVDQRWLFPVLSLSSQVGFRVDIPLDAPLLEDLQSGAPLKEGVQRCTAKYTNCLPLARTCECQRKQKGRNSSP